MALKSELEIRKRAVVWMNQIEQCARGCVKKPPGLYCDKCYRFRALTDELAWVLCVEQIEPEPR